MSLEPHLHARHSTPRGGPELAHTVAGPSVSALRAAVLSQRPLSICLVIVALHLMVLAVLSSGGTLVRIALLLCAAAGPPVLVQWLVRSPCYARVLVVGITGLAVTAAGLATSVPHAALTGVSGPDFTGIPATVAGIVMVALSFREAFRGRRLVVKLCLGTLAIYVTAQWLIAPAVNVGVITNAPRPTAAAASTLGLAGASDVSFPASDGVRLAGWYAPGRNGAAVIVLHGSHGTRRDTLAYLRLLHGAGYAVLAFDARGHGQSAGHTNALGWSGAQDVSGAVSFLTRQPGVNPRRIGALGLSMGAEEALRAVASGVPLSAVVADGAGASTLADDNLVGHGLRPVFTSVTWLTMRGAELVSGEKEPAGLGRLVARIRVPVLLISSNAIGEHTIDQIYRDRIGQSATLWYIPDTSHTGGLGKHPQEYAAHVDTFLAVALQGR